MGITYKLDNDLDVHNTRQFTAVKTTYDNLVKLFGEPLQVNTENTNVEWRVSFSDGEMLVVYDWHKDDPYTNTVWNVSGHTFLGTSRIYDILEGKAMAV